MLKINNLHAEIDGKKILKGLTLEVASGEIGAQIEAASGLASSLDIFYRRDF